MIDTLIVPKRNDFITRLTQYDQIVKVQAIYNQ